MKDPKDLPPDFSDLRRRAEERLEMETISGESLSPAEAVRLIHELQVHQIELELQNEELRQAQAQLAESRDKYADLYDFAPVGYLTLNKAGKILEVNLTGATMLGRERTKILGLYFPHFLVDTDRRVFRQLLNNGSDQRERRGEFHLQDGKGEGRVMLLDILLLQDAEGRERRRIAMTDISELKRTQEELRLHKEELEELVAERTAELIKVNEHLREANENLQALFEAAPVGIGVFDAEGKVIRVNPANERIFGWSKEEFEGRLPLCMPREAPDDSLALLERLLQGESFTGAEIKQQRKDGALIDVSLSAAPLRDAAGRLRGFIGLAEDITERKRTEEAVRTQARVLESMGEAVTVTDSRGRILYANPAFDVMFGYKPGELLGRHSNILNFYPPEENIQVVKEILGQVHSTGAWSGEFHNCKKNGQPFFTSARISTIKVGDKKLFISVQEDITERKRAEEMLHRQAELLDLAHDAIVVRDPKGRIIYWNQGATNHYGWPKEVALGKNYYKLLQTAFPEPLLEIERLLVGQGYWEGELIHTNLYGQRLVMNSRWTLKQDDEGRVVTILEISQDITAQKQIEKEIHRLASFPLLNPNPILEADEKGQVTYANPVARQVAEKLGKEVGVEAFLPPDLKKIVAAARQGGPRVYSFDKELGEAAYAIILHLPHDLPTVRLYAMDVTERKRAAEALRESELRFRQVVESLPQLVWTCQSGGSCDFLSSKWTEYTGIPESELMGFGWLNQVHPDDRTGLLKTWEVSKATGTDYAMEHRIRRYDGVYHWFDTRAMALRDQHGVIVKWFGSNTNIQEKRELLEALQKREAKLASILATAPVGIGLTLDRVIMDVNQQLCQMTGYAPEELLGKSSRLFYATQEEFDSVGLDKYRQMEEHGCGTVETCWQRKDGEIIEVLLSSSPLVPGDPTSGVTFTALDITERNRAEAALRESEARFRSLFEHMTEGVALHEVIFDDRGRAVDYRILATNPAYANHTGLNPEQVKGQLASRVYGMGEAPFLESFDRVAELGQPITFEFFFSPLQRHFRVSVTSPKQGHFVTVFEDITEPKRAEEALKRQHDLLQGINRTLHVALTCETKEDLGRTCLAVAEELTDSKFGFIGEINQAGLLDTIVISDPGWDICTIPGSDDLILIKDMRIHGIYGRVLQEGQSIITNNPAAHPDSIGVPEGHPPLTAFLGVPLKEGNQTVGMVGLGNKVGGYDQADQDTVETLSTAMAEAFQRLQAEEALRRARDELEERVEERTAALRLANEQLLWEIEERQETAERLQESEARFTAFMKHLPGLAVMRDVQGSYVFANEAWEQLMGKTRDDWQGKNLEALWTRETAQKYQQLDQQVLLAGEPVEVLETLEMADGLHHFLTYRFPIKDLDGLPYMVGAIGIDITARQRAEEALAAERQRFFSLLENLPAFIYLQDREYDVKFTNRQFRDRFGSPDGKTCYTLLWGREAPCPECPTFQVFHTGKPVDWEWQAPDGRTYQIYDYPFEDVDGSPLVLEMGLDITARKQAEEEARHQTRLFEAFFNHAITPLVFLDPQFNFIRVNQAYAQACQREAGGFIGRNHFDLYPQEENQAIFQEVVETKQPFVAVAKAFEFPDHPEWGISYWDWSLTPILDESGEVDFLVLSLNDVTEQVLAEEERRRLVEILENTTDFVGIADFYGNLQYLNRAGRDMVGVDQEEDVRQLKVLDLHPDRFGKLILQEGAPTARQEGSWQAEMALQHRDGREIPVSQVILAHKDDTGRVQFFSTIARDISDLKQAQENILRKANTLNGINRIFREALSSETPEELGRTCLAVAEELTDSLFGFLDELNEEGTLDALAFSDPGWDLCNLPTIVEPQHLKNIQPVGLLARPLREGKTIIANDPASHPEAAGIPKGHPPLTAFLGVPLIFGEQTIGLIGLGNKPGGYSLNDQETLETLSPSIVEALMHHQAKRDLQRSESKLRHLADQLLTAQENERKRLAAELHDELGHALLTLKLALSSIAKELLPGQKSIEKEIQEQLAYITDVIGEVRRLYHDLSPGDVEDLGLTKALQTLIEDFAIHQPHINWEVDLPILEGLFSQPVQTIIYRLVQEALTNIGKHANPEHVNISAVNEGSKVHFVIGDDGAGFDMVEVLESASGLGLVAMEERLNMLGGTFVVWSKKKKGTRLSFSIPTLPEDGK